MSTITTKEECTLGMKVTETRGFYLALTLTALGFGFLTGSANAVVYQLLLGSGIIQGSFYDNAWIAGFTEPILTKFLPAFLPMVFGVPAAVVVYTFVASLTLGVMFSLGHTIPVLALGAPVLLGLLTYLEFPHLRQFSCVDYERERWRAAPYTGFLFGVVELYTRNLGGSELRLFFWEMQTFNVNQFAPVILHVITGTFIVWSLMSVNRPRATRYSLAFAGLITGGLIHYIFNTWLQVQPWFWRTFYRVMTI